MKPEKLHYHGGSGTNLSINPGSALVAKTIFFITLAIFLFSASPAMATEDYAAETGQGCPVCHISASGGGGLTQAGESYSEDPGNWRPPVSSGRKTPVYLRIAHVVVLYGHLFFGIIWIGTIFYVHLVLKPRYALGGLPRSELRLAWMSMPILAVSGVLLTFWRLRLAPGLFSSLFGKLLLVKMAVFGLMVSSAAFVTLYVGPRLKALAAMHGPVEDEPGKDRYTLEELRDHDGAQGQRVFIAANGKVYDVSSSPMWKGGTHARRHKAGADLTEFLKDAPHESNVLDRYEMVGELDVKTAQVPAVVRIFTVNAYFNLIGCFVIILVLVLWRW
ncbi:MAG: cytochrome b5 domain-containing protein [bacterium]|nr:cytochrome b5 domain-containing protein [bacterium]MDT8395545.1 cytochrome b5 domain-containing protein [bacterium]